METLAAGILDGPALADRLAALREERMLLGGLRDDVELALRTVASSDLTAAWCSVSQRGYAERLAELRDDLSVAAGQLDDALTAVQVCISRLTAAG